MVSRYELGLGGCTQRLPMKRETYFNRYVEIYIGALITANGFDRALYPFPYRNGQKDPKGADAKRSFLSPLETLLTAIPMKSSDLAAVHSAV